MSQTMQKKKQSMGTTEISWPQTQIQQQLAYRVPMKVTELMVFRCAFRETGYYVCPRCRITMERELLAYCDRCGQKLDWRGYRRAKVIRR